MGFFTRIANLRGPKGDRGATGTIASATAEAVPAGSPASVTMTGSEDAKGVHFEIPRGLPGVNAVENDEAVAAYVGAVDSDTRAALRDGFVNGARSGDVDYPTWTFDAPTDVHQDNPRMRWYSNQWQYPGAAGQGEFGETLQFRVSDRAKTLQAYQLPVRREGGVLKLVRGEFGHDDPLPSGAFWKSLVWAQVFHYWSQNQADPENPDEVHGHISWELPEPGGALRTRFQMFFLDRHDQENLEVENALISTNKADLHVVKGRSNGVDWGIFKIDAYANNAPGVTLGRFVKWGDPIRSGDRWWIGHTAAESSGTNGSDLEIHRFDNGGSFIERAMSIERRRGLVTFGPEDPFDAPFEARVTASWASSGRSGYLSAPTVQLTGTSAHFKARANAPTEKFLLSQLHTQEFARFQVSADGAMEWGSGTAAPSLYLARNSSNRLAVGGNLELNNSGARIYIKSGNGTQYYVGVNNNGELYATAA